MMDEDSLRKSLVSLEDELRELAIRVAELQELQERRSAIHALVSQIRYVLRMPAYTATAIQPDSPKHIVLHPGPAELSLTGGTPTFTVRKLAIWERAREILRRAEGPMGLEQIVEALKGFNFKLDGRSGKETVRAILYKKSDVFERLEDGMYKLKVTGEFAANKLPKG